MSEVSEYTASEITTHYSESRQPNDAQEKKKQLIILSISECIILRE